MYRLRLLPVATICILLVGGHAYAGVDFDFSGTFTRDDQSVVIDFSVAAPSTVTVFSSSWLNHYNGLGFDPMLGIWTASGNLIEFQDDGGVVGSTLSNGVPYSHGSWDSYYTVNLNPGSYKASITQFDNFPVSNQLSAGFYYDGNPNFTFDNGYGPFPMFNGLGDDPRTGDWEFHLLNVETANIVPEPSTLAVWSLLGALGITVGWRRRRRVA